LNSEKKRKVQVSQNDPGCTGQKTPLKLTGIEIAGDKSSSSHPIGLGYGGEERGTGEYIRETGALQPYGLVPSAINFT